jgi:hypothetical protein
MTTPLPPTRPTLSLVVPIEQVAQGEPPIVRLRPGRCRRADARPTLSQRAYEAELSARASRMIDEDRMAIAASGSDAVAIVDHAMRAIAEESAALLWDRTHAIGKPGAEKLSTKRVNALVRLGELAAIRAQLAAASFEPRAEDVERVVALLMGATERVVTDIAEPEMAARFLAHMKESMAAADFPACCTRRIVP